MKRKTVSQGKKRYKKTKPGDLFVVSVYDHIYERDKDGEAVEEHDETIQEPEAMGIQKLLDLIESQIGINRYMTYDFSGNCGWIDGDYSDLYHRADEDDEIQSRESQLSIVVNAEPHRIARLDRVIKAKINAPERENDRRNAEARAREQAKQAHRAKFKVLNGGNEFIARRSQAPLKLAGAQ